VTFFLPAARQERARPQVARAAAQAATAEQEGCDRAARGASAIGRGTDSHESGLFWKAEDGNHGGGECLKTKHAYKDFYLI
jgi:hypothetical protein